MRGQLFVAALLALTISACGSSSNQEPDNKPLAVGGEGAVGVTSGKKKSSVGAAVAPVTTTQEAPAKPLKVKRTYVAPTVRVKTASGKAPAVVLLPDTTDSARADSEAKKLARLGVGALVVVGPGSVPSQEGAFDQAVAAALKALKTLRARDDVDRQRIGFIGEGVGAHVGAVAIGRRPGAVSAAVLADIGGVVVPSAKFAPEKWLARANGIRLLFQRDTAKRAMTQQEVARLMDASPPGTLMEQYQALGASAELARDRWIKQQLLAG